MEICSERLEIRGAPGGLGSNLESSASGDRGSATEGGSESVTILKFCLQESRMAKLIVGKIRDGV